MTLTITSPKWGNEPPSPSSYNPVEHSIMDIKGMVMTVLTKSDQLVLLLWELRILKLQPFCHLILSEGIETQVQKYTKVS
jgi:hypothetical protein